MHFFLVMGMVRICVKVVSSVQCAESFTGQKQRSARSVRRTVLLVFRVCVGVRQGA